MPTRAEALSAEAVFKESLEREVPLAANRLRLYLAGDDLGGGAGEGGRGTVAVLLGHVQERVVDAYVAFCKAVEFIPADEGEGGSRTALSENDIRAFFNS